VVADIFEQLRDRVVSQLRTEGFDDQSIRSQRSIDMRYRRQVHIVTVPVAGSDSPITAQTIEETIAGFETLYREKYGEESAYRDAGIELISFRFRGEGSVRKPEPQLEEVGGEDAADAIVKQVPAWVDKLGSIEELAGYDFERLVAGNRIPGPAIVWTPITTLVITPGQTARVDEHKNIVVTSGASR
jgi:N-methylhydantoinase A